MKKMIKNVGMDVHKNSISIGIAEDGRDGEVMRYYGKIDNDLKQLDKVIQNLFLKELYSALYMKLGLVGTVFTVLPD